MPGKKSVLIADDDRGLVQLLRLSLEPLGLLVREAHDALSALQLAHEQIPDLMVLDVNMPTGSGLGACEMLAADPALSRLPVIGLTGRSDDGTILRCQKLGVHYVCKGVDAIDRIQSLARRLLNIGGDTHTPTALFVG